MRGTLGWTVGLGLLLASACSSSKGGNAGTTGGPSGFAPGTACDANDQCASNLCGTSGAGHCCSFSCPVVDSSCSATDCDTTGSCSYPGTDTICAYGTCDIATFTPKACNGEGICAVQPAGPCPGNFACDSTGKACQTECGRSSECANGFYCVVADGGTCLPQLSVGACTQNDACTSNLCGIAGTGHCCTAACASGDAGCGATDCGAATGLCDYPSATTPCSTQSCTDGTEINAASCDGSGHCPASSRNCAPFVCGADACLTSCATGADCAGSGAFCDVTTDAGFCCPALSNGDTLNVDAVAGDDSTLCCGVGGNGPCQTLTRAMALINAAQASNVTINATIGDGGGDWAPAGEVYPVVLGWGVELSAPGISFFDPSGIPNAEILDVKNYPNDSAHSASIVGSGQGSNAVRVGMNTTGSQQTTDLSAIAVENGATLYLANAMVNGSAVHQTTAITVQPGAALTLAQDQSAATVGTVTIGNAGAQHASNGWQGIVCGTDGVQLGCTINDFASLGQTSVLIQGQEFRDLDAEDFANITLVSSPVIGVLPKVAGHNQCPSKSDVSSTNPRPSPAAAILLNGAANLTLENGTVECISGAAFYLQTSPNGNGNPTLSLSSAQVSEVELGLYASAGTAMVSNTYFTYNFNGIQQATDGTHNGAINLSSGGNAVHCSSNVESSQRSLTPGVNVYNDSAVNLNASNVAWDTAGPDLFSCDPTLTTCTCLRLPCADTPGTDGMDAVEDATLLGGITTTNNRQEAAFNCP
jgi:hypothetical protein